MKNTLLIFALLLFSFFIGNTEPSGERITILHRAGNNGANRSSREWVVMDIPIEALEVHLSHGDELPCVPPQC